MDTETPAWSELVPLPVISQRGNMFARVSAEFHATLSRQDYRVCKIYRVQNLDLWHKYQKYVSGLCLR